MKYIKTFEANGNIKKPLTLAIKKFLTHYYGYIKMLNLFTVLSSDKITVLIELKKNCVFINFPNYKKNEKLTNYIKTSLDKHKIENRNFVLAFQELRFVVDKSLINDLVEMFEDMDTNGEFDVLINTDKFNL